MDAMASAAEEDRSLLTEDEARQLELQKGTALLHRRSLRPLAGVCLVCVFMVFACKVVPGGLIPWGPTTVSQVAGRTQLSEEADCIKVPDKCSEYKFNFKDCNWTKKWSCPEASQPGSATTDGSGGRATDDGSVGFSCCCEASLWRTFTDGADAKSTCATEAADAEDPTELPTVSVAPVATPKPVSTPPPLVLTIGSAGVGLGKQCTFPFTYKDVTYNECTVTDNTVFWCYVEVDDNGKGVKGKWGECPEPPQALPEAKVSYAEVCTIGEAGVGAGKKCAFPFKYKDNTYTGCSVVDNTVPWCYVKVDDQLNGVMHQWGECGSGASSCEGKDDAA